MWDHYGDKHKGVCLILNKQKVIDQLDIYKNNSTIYSNSVEYVSSEYKSNDCFQIYYEDTIENLNQYAEAYINKNYKDFLFKKYPEWEQEEEFRLLLITNKNNTIIKKCNNSGNKYIPIELNDIIEGIVFGIEAKPKNELLNKLKEKNIQIEQLITSGWNITKIPFNMEAGSISLDGVSFYTNIPCNGVLTYGTNSDYISQAIIINNDGSVSIGSSSK